MRKQKTKKFLKILFIITVIFFIVGSGNNIVQAEISTSTATGGFGEWLKESIGYLLKLGAGALLSPLVSLATALELVIFVILYLLFLPLDNGWGFPFPDQIIFNNIAALDVNIFNPAENSIVGYIGGVVQNLYWSFYTIAGAVFMLAILAIGVKLAISTIASDKALYKEKLLNWIVGVVILVLLPFIMSLIFRINEVICKACYEAAADVSFSFDAGDILETIAKLIGTAVGGFIGNFVGSLVGGLLDNLLDSFDFPEIAFQGYSGLVMVSLLKALSGDLTYMVIFGMILGQTCALIVMYVNRLVHIVFLCALSPLVITMDVIQQAFR